MVSLPRNDSRDPTLVPSGPWRDRLTMDPGISFVDLAGFTALTEAHGDDHAADLIERFVEIAHGEQSTGDRVVKSIGDAVLLRSPSGRASVELTVRVMRRCAREPEFPLARGGVHAGPIVERASDVFGATVNLAARIASCAHGGQLLVSATVRGQLVDPALTVVDLGEFEFRNVTAPLHLFEVPLGLDGGCGGIDPVCRMRVERDRAGGSLRYEGTDYWLCSLTCAALFATNPGAYVSGATVSGATPDRLAPG